MKALDLTDSFTEFKEFKSIDRETLMHILEEVFPNRQVVGIDSTDIIWGLGSFHCLSQQMPE